MLSRVWFITGEYAPSLCPQLDGVLTTIGCSTGLGRDLVHTALARNDKVIATARRLSTVEDLASDHCKVLELNLDNSFEEIKAKVQEAITFWGHVDVVVNNGGFGVFGTVEEQGWVSPWILRGRVLIVVYYREDLYMQQFKTNLFGCLNVTNAFVPHLRDRGEGTIVNVGSRSAWRTNLPVCSCPCHYVFG